MLKLASRRRRPRGTAQVRSEGSFREVAAQEERAAEGRFLSASVLLPTFNTADLHEIVEISSGSERVGCTSLYT